MSLHKMQRNLNADEEGDVGIGTLIIFIAIVLVAAIAASLILYATALLQQQAQKTVDESVSEVSGGLAVINIAGDRNPAGADSVIVSAYMPSADEQAPLAGVLYNVTASGDGTSPLVMVLNWSSATDYGSGLSEEIVYRTSVYDPTNPSSFNEQIARNRLLTLDQIDSSYELVRFDSGFGPAVQYSDYSARDDNATSYAYAIVGVDNAGNRVIYGAIDSSASTIDTTQDEDRTVPSGGSMTSTAKPDDYSVALFWVPATDAGSGVNAQYLYRSEVSVSAPGTVVVDGRTRLVMPDATLLAGFNATVSSYVDSPPAVGDYTYFVVAEDSSCNQVYIGSLTYTATVADSGSPTPVSDLCMHQSLQAVSLTWTSGSDEETDVRGYCVFRAASVAELDSIEELLSMSPLAMLGADATSYDDYSGSGGSLYYYTVMTVDSAGNYAQPVVATNTIQMIEIKVKTVPGSDPIVFTSLMIEITDGERDATLRFNAGTYGPEGATNTSFSVEILRDPDSVFATTYSLTDGGLVKIFIDAGEIGLNLHAESSFMIKFIPSFGQPTIEECMIPYIGTYRYINLV